MEEHWIGLRLIAPSLSTWQQRWLNAPDQIAIIEQGIVLDCTQAAYQAGVRQGMRRASAIGMAPDCRMLDRNPQAEQELLDRLSQLALRYTPNVTQYLNHTVLLEVAGSLNLFAGPRSLVKALRRDCATSRLNVSISMAPSAMGAWLLVQSTKPSSRRFLHLTKLHRMLNRMPCVCLPAASPYLIWFANMGCETLGQLRRLPRAGLKRRSSGQLLEELDQAYGEAIFKYKPYLAPSHFQQKIDLMDRAENTSAIQGVIDMAINNLCAWLAAKQCAILRLKLIFYHERYQQSDSSSELILSMAEPAWLSMHVLKLLKEKLAKHTFESPAVAVELVSVELSALPAGNGLLFADKRHQSADLRRLLDLIAMRIEPENVRHPMPINDYRPEIANRWHAYRSASPQAQRVATSIAPATMMTTAIPNTEQPFWLLNQPLALSMQRDRPVFGSPLQLLQGPERIESGWWDAPLTARDYFVAQDRNGIRYWIYRERDTDPVHWFLHGLFA